MGVFIRLVRLTWKFNGRTEQEIRTAQADWNPCDHIYQELKTNSTYAHENDVLYSVDYYMSADLINPAFPEFTKSRPILSSENKYFNRGLSIVGGSVLMLGNQKDTDEQI